MNALEELISSLRQTIPHCDQLALTVVRALDTWEEVVRKYDDLVAERDRLRSATPQTGGKS